MTALTMFDSATPWDANNPVDGLQRLRHIKQIGGIGVTFYIRGTPGGMRHAIKADVELARSLGLGCMPNWESTADFFRTATRQQCIDAGKEAFDSAAALGFPLDGSVRVSFSFDYQIPDGGLDRAMRQLDWCQEGVGHGVPVSVYGQHSFIRYLGEHGRADEAGHWLMGSTWHWNPMVQSDPKQRALYDIGSPYVAAVQSHDLAGNWLNSPVRATDISTVTQPEKLGAWWPDGSEFAVPAITKDDVQAVVRAELEDFGRAMLTGQDSGYYTHKRFPAWVGEPGLRDLAKHALSDGDIAKLSAKLAAAVPGATQDTLEAAIKSVLSEGVGS